MFSNGQGLSTQVAVSSPEGLKHASWIMCDNLASIRKADLTNYIGQLSITKFRELERALKMALDPL